MSDEFRQIVFGDEARTRILRGVNKLAEAVRVTMGPSGQNVIIERQNMVPHLTKDGVTVAQAVKLRDHYENLGAQIVKEAAQKTADIAGDGTTTATVLAHTIYSNGLKMMAAGFDATELCRGIMHASKYIENKLTQVATPIENDSDIIHVGTISANGDRSIGVLLCDAVKAVGPGGSITVDEARGFETTLEIVEGTQLDRGFLSPYFVTNSDKMTCEMINPLIMLASKKIAGLREILQVLEYAHEVQRPLLIVADDIEGEALQGLVVNKLKGTLQICAIRSPEFGDARIHAMEDLSILLNAEVYTPVDFSAATLNVEKLGTCKKVIIGKNSTTIIGCDSKNSLVQSRIQSLKLQSENPLLNESERALILRSLTRLAEGIAIIKVGGATEIELRERKDRVDDALCATQAAIAEGIVPGGGIALLRASTGIQSLMTKNNKDFDCGLQIIQNACQEPLRQIVNNTGGAPDVVLNKVLRLKGNMGYDARNEKYGDMLTLGIIDPVKVVRFAMHHASSAACNLLSIGCAMVFDEKIDDDNDVLNNIIENE